MQTFRTDTCLRHDLRFAPDGRRLAVGSQTRVLLDTLGSEPPVRLVPPTRAFTAHARLALGSRALVYATPTDDPHARVWHLDTDRVDVWPDVARGVYGIAVSPDGATAYIATAVASGWDWVTELRAFDAATGGPRAQFPALPNGLSDLTASADGRRLAGRHMWSVGVWDLTDPGAPHLSVRVPPHSSFAGVALSADGSRLAAATNRAVILWALAPGGGAPEELFRSGKHRRRTTAVACSPTRPLIATGDAAGLVFLWDFEGRALARYEWGLGEVSALCFAPDGLRCAAADDGGKLVVWDVDA